MIRATFNRLRQFIVLGVIMTIFSSAVSAENFETWKRQFKEKARKVGISDATIRLLERVEFNPQVIELDRKQPEFTQSVAQYVAARIAPLKGKGTDMLLKHRKLLKAISNEYAIPPFIIVALWGIETNFGKTMGGFSVIRSLATLAADPRRSAYFSQELLVLLSLIDQGHLPFVEPFGSWAGAMGQCQFMPSNIAGIAVDYDQDGTKDLWSSHADVFASIANFLATSGWEEGKSWGYPVKLPIGFDLSLLGLEISKMVKEWTALDVSMPGGEALPDDTDRASLIQPDGPGTQAFLVLSNFRTLMKWNRSYRFAIAVGMLADSLQSR